MSGRRQVGGIPALVGKAAFDKGFCDKFLADPIGVAKESGLTEEEIQTLQSISLEDLKKALSSFDPIRTSDRHRDNHSSSHSNNP
jgi:hypothetical protein